MEDELERNSRGKPTERLVHYSRPEIKRLDKGTEIRERGKSKFPDTLFTNTTKSKVKTMEISKIIKF